MLLWPDMTHTSPKVLLRIVTALWPFPAQAAHATVAVKEPHVGIGSSSTFHVPSAMDVVLKAFSYAEPSSSVPASVSETAAPATGGVPVAP